MRLVSGTTLFCIPLIIVHLYSIILPALFKQDTDSVDVDNPDYVVNSDVETNGNSGQEKVRLDTFFLTTRRAFCTWQLYFEVVGMAKYSGI